MVPIGSRIATTMHNILYVMAEGNQYQRNEMATRKIIFLFLIDFLQVVRVVTSPLYGWSEETTSFVQNFDVVYLFTDATSTVVPRYSLFIFASVLVLVAVGDTVYVARIFSQGDVHQLWPVKVLRFLVTALVTTFFSSVIKWLLIPVDCLVTDETSLSHYMHGAGAKCNPWRSPEISVSIPTLILSVFYCFFALTASFFFFEINPLSCSPAAKCTGRVEISFLFMKIASTFLVYLAHSVTTLGTSIILFVFSISVFYYHITVLPFHDKFINQIRGGIHAALMWLAFGGVIVSAVDSEDAQEETGSQTMQWAFIGCMPLAALLGAWAVAKKRNRLTLLLDRLRGQWESNTARKENPPRDRPLTRVESWNEYPDREYCEQTPVTAGSDAGTGVVNTQPVAAAGVQGVYEYFYNPTWERKRAFSSSNEAYAAIRTLLHKRDEKDLPFLLHLLNRGMEEFPQSHPLKVFYLLLVRFVFTDQEDEVVKKSTETLPLSMDLKYALYAVERKRSQEIASASLGRGTINAISLMEFDSGLERAKKAHADCITHMKSFWHLLGRRKGKVLLDANQLADKMLQELAALERATSSALEAYESLLHKYPTSLAVLTGFSHFCDVVLNDGKRARELREKAQCEEQATPGDDNASRALDDVAGRSQSSASETASWRSCVSRTVHSWIHHVMAGEARGVLSLRFRERCLVVVLLIGISASFVACNVVLYSNEAKKYMRLVRRAGELRINLATAAYDLRNQHMAAWFNDPEAFAVAQKNVVKEAEEIRAIHYENYRNVVSPNIADLFNQPVFATFEPTGGLWTAKRLNLWDMINDAARRGELASRTSADEMRDTNFSIPYISEAKRNVAFVQENWLRTLAPSLDTLIEGYEQEMQQIGTRIRSVIYSSCAACGVVIVLLAFLVLRSLTCCLQDLQHKQIACKLAASLPRSVSRKLYLFYQKVDIDLKIIEDEELERMYTEGKLMLGDEEGDRDMAIRSPEPVAASEDGGCGVAPPGEPLTMRNVEAHIRSLDSPKGREARSALPEIIDGQDAQLSLAKDSNAETDAIEKDQFFIRMPTIQHGLGESVLVTRSPPLQASGLREQLSDASISPYSTEPPADAAQDPASNLKPQTGTDSPTREMNGGDWEAKDGLADDALTDDAGSRSDDRAGSVRDDDIASANEGEELNDSGADDILAPVKGSEGQNVPVAPTETAFVSHPRTPLAPIPAPSKLDRDDDDDGVHEGSVNGHEHVDFSCRAGPGKVKFTVPDAAPTRRRSSLKYGVGSPFPEQSAFKGAGGHVERAAVRRGSMHSDEASSEGRDDAGNEETSEGLELTPLDPAFVKRVKFQLTQKRSFFLQTTVFVAIFSVILGHNLLFHLYPARTIGDLVNLAPMIDQASRRVFNILALSSLARELVLDDGFSRLSKSSLVGAIDDVVQRLENANSAIRFGNSLGIKVGADERNEDHNHVMYAKGCPWREDPSNCTMKSKSHAADSGLLFLVNTYLDSVRSVVMRYAANVSPDSEAFRLEAEDYMPRDFNEVVFRQQRAALLESDTDVAFILENFQGDVTEGFRLIMRMFSAEADDILARADYESELLYTVFVLLIIACYHVALFRKTVKLSLAEVEKAKEFVLRQPIHTLDYAEHQVFASFFSPEIQVGGDAAALANRDRRSI